MKQLIAAFICCFITINLFSQVPDVKPHLYKKDVYFLASDELEGRKTGAQGNLVAARYIAESFRALGLESPEGIEDYYQKITFDNTKPAETAMLTLRDTTLKHGDQVLFMGGKEDHMTEELVFIDQGWINDTINHYEGVDLNGKIAVALFGVPGSTDPRDGFRGMTDKKRWAEENGAVGLIEIYSGGFPWNIIKRFFNREQTLINDSKSPSNPDFQHILSDYKFTSELASLKDGEKIEVVLESSGVQIESTFSPNVVGWLEGSDPDMKDEYIILSAHFDHVGLDTRGNNEDKIFNGARDNAVGTSAILAAARHFSENRPKRSILFLAFTAEEIGLLGSDYYVDHPVKPLDKAIFNMNIDGAGYNDTTRVTVLGYERVGVKEIFDEATAAVGLTAYGDTAPEQGLFDRSDNVNFAKVGIPAPTYSLGFTAFDAEINKYYHKTSDNPDNLNYEYILKYVKSYIYTAREIANRKEAPKWQEGDKYEAAYNKLYNMP
ncbi:MAG: M20/M25/M40 family metallo-hydrolase [Saprospiraceae bacterium]|nr:M20/M25/M40 family metallo-hydrolase [Saprospiraceae bacterium]